jgi:Kef-type K+ transport system membrane component KefB
MSFAEVVSLSNMELTRFFFAIVSLLVSAHFFGYLFHRFKMPKVIGEIFGGLILGPSFLGFFFPDIFNWIFNAFESEGKLISLIYWFGLVLLMFISGFEIQKSFNKGDKKLIVAIVLGSTIIPLIAGLLAPTFYDFSSVIGVKNNILALKIVIAIAVAVTSIPVISKIFIDLNIMNSRFAKIVLATATIHDVILWIALAIATGLVSAEAMSISEISSTVIITVVFFGIALLFMPKLIRFSNDLRANLLIKSSVSGYALFICFFFAAIANILNVNIVFGAFLAGIIIGTMSEDKFGTVKGNIKDISLGFFVPIYFAVVGIKLDLIHNLDIGFLLGFLLFTTFFVILGTIIFAKFVKADWFSSFNLGVAMSARGGPGIVLATVAFDLGIINEAFFVSLVLIAIITSLLAGLWFRFVLSKGWKLLAE